MQSWRERHQELMADYDGQTWFGNMLEYAPKLMWARGEASDDTRLSGDR